MPSLILFGRRWRIGSDDFVFPGIFEAVVRSAWLILTLVLFYEHIKDSEKLDPDEISSCKKGETLIRIYVVGVLAILSLSFLLSVTLTIHSAKGTIMTTAPRRYVPQILIFRVVLGIFEVGWNILGTLWLYSDQVQCEKNSAIWVLLEALVILTWVALPVLILAAIILFEPMMRPERRDSQPRPSSILDRTNSGIGSHYIQLWERRCRILCCTFARDENSAEAFRNVADVLASLFEESDLVASDIAAALVLLRLKKKYEEVLVQTDNSNANRNLRNAEKINHHFKSPPPDWMNLQNAHHFMKFALGSYGWPWFFYGRMIRALVSVRKFLKCCGCWRSYSIGQSKDNCCRCNLAALRAITGLPEENIIYLSFHNKIYETPFFVAIDDDTKNVVVSIRGTLSLYDTITDLNAQSTLLVYDGLPSGCRAHKGMVNVAQFVKRKLEETGAIEEGMLRREGYGLIITGHSLGAGAAVILSAMMRPLYPNLKCFAFSPPGGLCSIEMYTATQNFVMSVVVGDDLVPRLSIAAIHDLHNKTINVLNACRKPKYRVLAKGCWYMLFGISRSSLQSCTTGANPQDHLISPANSGSYSYVSPTTVEEESIQDIRIMFSEEPFPLPRHTETPLFPPGRILYLTPKPGIVDKESMWDARWASNAEFQEILITPLMLRHHLPHIVLRVLETSLTYNETLL